MIADQKGGRPAGHRAGRSDLLLHPGLVARLEAPELWRRRPQPLAARGGDRRAHADRQRGLRRARAARSIPAWSPDSRWIAYTKRLDNQYNAIYVYDVEDGSRHAITDGLSDCRSPAWDAGGKYLYFLASTDYGLNVGWLDMTNYDHEVNSTIYAAVLAADEPSPLEPESDEEEVDGEDERDDEGEDGGNDDGDEERRGSGRW